MTDTNPYPITTLRVPNPFFEGRNRVYVIHSDPITIIDTGVATERAQQELRTAFREHNIAVSDIGRVVLTHKHIDHIGSAWWIQQESDAEIFIHETEMSSISDVDPEGHRWRQLLRDRLATWNVPESARPPADAASGFTWNIQPARATPITGGEAIDLGGIALEVIHTPGHTRGSVCLKYGRKLFSGDHVLPDISPNIGGGDLSHSGLLADFMASLRICREMASEIDEVFPGHGAPFSTLRERSLELQNHHEQRLEQVTDLLNDNGPQSVYSIAKHLFGEIENIHVILGCAEAEAHVENLVHSGAVTADAGMYSMA